jgi:hypothetical protein
MKYGIKSIITGRYPNTLKFNSRDDAMKYVNKEAAMPENYIIVDYIEIELYMAELKLRRTT